MELVVVDAVLSQGWEPVSGFVPRLGVRKWCMQEWLEHLKQWDESFADSGMWQPIPPDPDLLVNVHLGVGWPGWPEPNRQDAQQSGWRATGNGAGRAGSRSTRPNHQILGQVCSIFQDPGRNRVDGYGSYGPCQLL